MFTSTANMLAVYILLFQPELQQFALVYLFNDQCKIAKETWQYLLHIYVTGYRDEITMFVLAEN